MLRSGAGPGSSKFFASRTRCPNKSKRRADRVQLKCYALTQMQGLSLLQTVAVAMLILANAFFVAAEFALVSIRATRVEQMLSANLPGARAVRRLQHGLDELLPAVQLGVTLCSLALGWLGEPLAAAVVAGWLGPLPYSAIYGHIAAVTLGFALITYFHQCWCSWRWPGPPYAC
jgi:hypothetical protein